VEGSEIVEKKKLFWVAFAFLFFSILFFHLIIFPEAPNSEGLMMISDIGERILGIDFSKKEFIYLHPREKKILPFLSVVKQDFFPQLKLKIFGAEVPISWKEYHGGLLAWFFKILDKLFFFLGEFLRSQIKIYLFHSLFSFFFLFFLFRLLKEYFFIDKFVVYSLLFFTLTSSIFYYFRSALHHSQAGIFILGIIYFLKNRRYILAGLFAGLAVYSYLPIIFAVSGITLAYFLYQRDFRFIFFVALFSIIFSAPHLYYIYSSQNESFYEVYNCSNCVGLFPPNTLNYHIRGHLDLYETFKILLEIFISLFFLLFKISEVLGLAFRELRESFSLSDVMLKYGMLIHPPPLKKISDAANLIHLIILAFGIFYIKRRFEIVVYLLSLVFYALLSKHFLLLPKMIYFLFPIYALVAVRVFNEFILHRQNIIALIFVVSSILRLAEFIHLNKNLWLIDLKTNLEVIDFFKDKEVKSDEILLYCYPPPFKIFTNGRLNPPVFLLIFEKFDDFITKRSIEFVINQTNFKYIVFDISFLQHVFQIIENDDKGLELKIVFRNAAFFVAEIERNNKGK
jgi:hypothetical protein